MNVKGLVKALLSILGVIGFLMLIPTIIDPLYGYSVPMAFLYLGIIAVLLSVASAFIEAEPLTVTESMVVANLTWILSSIISATALYRTIEVSFIDAFFESVSGFTGTGLTVFRNLDYMRPSVLIWRSIMQWSGELGIVVFAIVIFPYFYRIGLRVYVAERPFKLEASFYRTAVEILKVYSILTAIGFLIYFYTGMTIFESTSLIMTTIATGGMSPYDHGYEVVFERSPATYIPVMVFMFIGALNFSLLVRVYKGELGALKKSEEFRLYFSIAIIMSFLVASSCILNDKHDLWRGFISGFFNNVSALSTTGFNIGSILALSDTTKVLLTVSMFIGAMSFSTGGGIKALRLLIFIKRFKLWLLKVVSPTPIKKALTIDGVQIDEDEVSNALVFIVLHALVALIGALIVSSQGYSFVDSLFEVVSAISCVGLSSGITSSTAPIGVKATLITLMLLGRLEYIQIASIMGYFAWRKTMKGAV
ncbi:MAG: TrkH family potassium uptake protein [Sulfolobales archaeon]|nr:TrkH family potassium uptake protein [Sulfolobales archaeon]MCX8199506.1 TrkH family potassium uptake protein [Sulfolobales archaeon]MDW8170459.1 TrkH family potassium uptake protein [Desulfurococcaceae archaeon]